MTKQSFFKGLMYRFSQADAERQFNFSSGHLGALPISANEMVDILTRKGSIDSYKLHYFLLIEFLKFLVFLVLPIKNLAIVLRAFGRKFANKPTAVSNVMTVLSLGGASAGNDAYFGALLKTLQEEFNYVKIVGGSQWRPDGFQYIEGALHYETLARLLIKTPVYPLIFIFNLLSISRRGLKRKEQMLFIVLGLRDINTGSALNNKIIINALVDHIDSTSVRKVLYPMEGRNWEKRIVQEMNERKIHSIGYLHCALTPRHLSLLDPRFSHSLELPSKMVAPGEMAYNFLTKQYPTEKVIKGYFLRGDKIQRQQLKSDPSQLLFALTGNIEESEKIISHVARLDIKKNRKVVIRLNPNTSSYKQLLTLANKLKISLYSAEENLIPQVCFFRSSSVALDYLKLNVIPVYLNLDEVISNNIFELDNKYQFESIRIDDSMNKNLQLLLAKLEGYEFNGVEIANYYLDQDYDSEQLLALLN